MHLFGLSRVNVEHFTNPYDKIREYKSKILNLLFPYSTKRCMQSVAAVRMAFCYLQYLFLLQA